MMEDDSHSAGHVRTSVPPGSTSGHFRAGKAAWLDRAAAEHVVAVLMAGRNPPRPLEAR
jgi:hypothetical protein